MHLDNSPLIEHSEDMNQHNLLLAAAVEELDVMSVQGLRARGDSEYEWNELVIRFSADTTGPASHRVTECWRLVFEGGFLREGPDHVGCPDGPAVELPTPATAPPVTYSPEVVAELDSLRGALEAVLAALPRSGVEPVAFEADVEAALSAFEPVVLDAAVVNGIAVVAVMDNDVCILGRRGELAEVWEPVVGSSIDTCTANQAAQGGP